ncbi:elongation factor Ts [Patescibacteria group bacterium]|nr:elongation factor Ts [Patescibacteria group bacterium]
MAIQLEEVKKLREITSAPITACKEALEEADGDFEKAQKLLRKRGAEVMDKKAGRESKEGWIGSYVHSNGKIGVLVKIYCETDFVARNDEFKAFVHDVAIQIAATGANYLNPEDVPDADIDEEKKGIMEAAKKEGKPEEVIEKIVDGKMNKMREERSLMLQPLVRDSEQTLKDLLTDITAKLGEKIEIGEFVRFEL